MNPEQIIRTLDLKPHPEGGYYKETFRSGTKVQLSDGRIRSAYTNIFYLLSGNQKSHFHKVASDETWLFHAGHTIEILVVNHDGELEKIRLGSNIEIGEVLQFTVPANLWFGAKLINVNGYGLVSCVVAPGFEFEDFVLATDLDFNELKSIPSDIMELMIKRD